MSRTSIAVAMLLHGAVAVAAFCCEPAAAQESVSSESKAVDLLESIDTRSQAIAGQWTRSANGLRVTAAEGARLELAAPALPSSYDLTVEFTRRSGSDSIAIIFPVADNSQATLEVDAWGEHLAGFQQVDDEPLNRARRQIARVQLLNGTRYSLQLQVRPDSLTATLDGEVIERIDLPDHQLSPVELWRTPRRDRLAIGAWNSTTDFHSIELTAVGQPAVAATPEPTPPTQNSGPSPVPTPDSTSASSNRNGANGDQGERRGRVLIVIANHHFFYREYADPRHELERAGYEVVVAAGRRGTCRPHQGSGEGADGGVVRADVAIEQVKAEDYDAVLFSGGWGASAYQFAFDGRYDEAAYNGERSIKREVNRVINEFVEQDKYVAALCNGVSILAWARVDGRSPLAGKTVCAPVRQAAAGVYNGRPAQPSCRWHPEANGARMSPAGSIGQPGTAEDDVAVDGKIITGEDDISAREMGRVLVRVLNESLR